MIEDEQNSIRPEVFRSAGQIFGSRFFDNRQARIGIFGRWLVTPWMIGGKFVVVTLSRGRIVKSEKNQKQQEEHDPQGRKIRNEYRKPETKFDYTNKVTK